MIVISGNSGIYVGNAEGSGAGYFNNFGYQMNFSPRVADWSSKNEIIVSFLSLDILDGSSGQPITRVEDFGPSVVGWSPDGDYVASNWTDGIRIIHADTWTVARTFDSAFYLWVLDWSPDGSRIATGSQDGVIGIWDMSSLPDVSGVPTLTPLPTYTPSNTPTPTATTTPALSSPHKIEPEGVRVFR
jgi:WD40 repeat protein